MGGGSATGLGGLAGTAAGFAIGGPLGAGIGAMAGSTLGNLLFDQPNAASQYASAQQSIAQSQLAQQQATQQQALGYAQMTPQQIANLEQQLNINTQSYNRNQALINSSDPALIAAGQQALQLLNGQKAAALGPIEQQRAQQRQTLEAQLRQQLGPGYATSTAGAQALNNFDMQTSQLSTQAQQSTLGMLLGTAQNTSAQYNPLQNVQAGNLINSQYAQNQGLEVSALTNNPITYAGANYYGQLAQSQANANNANTMNSLFGSLGGLALSGAFNKAPTSGGTSDLSGMSSGSTGMLGGNYDLPKYSFFGG